MVHLDLRGRNEDIGVSRETVPVTSLFLSYMVPVPLAVKAESDGGGSGKTDYRNLERSPRAIRKCPFTMDKGDNPLTRCQDAF